jgi:hypothetical protein
VIASVLAVDEPQVLFAVTLSVPEVALFAKLMVIDVPVPFIVAPVPL